MGLLGASGWEKRKGEEETAAVKKEHKQKEERRFIDNSSTKYPMVCGVLLWFSFLHRKKANKNNNN